MNPSKSRSSRYLSIRGHDPPLGDKNQTTRATTNTRHVLDVFMVVEHKITPKTLLKPEKKPQNKTSTTTHEENDKKPKSYPNYNLTIIVNVNG